MIKNRFYWMSLTLAALGFAWVFACPHGNFWIKMSITVSILTGVSLFQTGLPWHLKDLNVKEVLLGISAAGLLYALFFLGDAIATRIFGFAAPQISSIYAIRELGNPWVIGAILFLLTSPGEELFWRGYVQKQAALRWGESRGMVVGTLLYGAVHLVSGNIMLVCAATLAGLFWCSLYRWRHNLTACLISHALWTVSVFLLFPIRS